MLLDPCGSVNLGSIALGAEGMPSILGHVLDSGLMYFLERYFDLEGVAVIDYEFLAFLSFASFSHHSRFTARKF